MSSPRKRHVVYDIGTVSANGSSKEFDLSSCTNAIVHMTRSGSSEVIGVRWESLPFPAFPVTRGGSDVWYSLHNVGQTDTGAGALVEMGFLWDTSFPDDLSIQFGTGQNESYSVMDSRSPRRARIRIESTSVTLTSVMIEGTRSIA